MLNNRLHNVITLFTVVVIVIIIPVINGGECCM